jgi:hypothetical protein
MTSSPNYRQLLAAELDLLDKDLEHLRRLRSRYVRQGMYSAARLVTRNIQETEKKAAQLRARLDAA